MKNLLESKRITAFRAFLKKKFERIKNERIKHNLMLAFPFWVASALTGLLAVFYAKVFAIVEHLSFEILHDRPYLIFIFAPLCFFLGGWLVNRFSPYARGSGIPQVMAAIDLSEPNTQRKVDRFLGIKVIWVKIVSSLTMLFGGAAIGREGPTIQIAASVFRVVNRVIPADWPKVSSRNMITTGAAAGLAAAFNTPLGGIVFAVEELSKTHISFFRTALFSAVIIAGLTAQALLGPYLYLGYPKVAGLSWFIMSIVVVVAIFGGLAGGSFGQLILRSIEFRLKLKRKYQVTYLIMCGLAIASLSYFVSDIVVGSGNETMSALLFSEDKTSNIKEFFLRFIGPVISFTAGGAGGVFAPSLATGATIGGMAADVFKLTGSDANLVILTGMVGFLTGVTRTPFTSSILVLEMTDRHSVIFYLMIAGMVASLAALMVSRHSFYEHLKRQFIKDATAKPAERRFGRRK